MLSCYQLAPSFSLSHWEGANQTSQSLITVEGKQASEKTVSIETVLEVSCSSYIDIDCYVLAIKTELEPDGFNVQTCHEVYSPVEQWSALDSFGYTFKKCRFCMSGKHHGNVARGEMQYLVRGVFGKRNGKWHAVKRSTMSRGTAVFGNMVFEHGLLNSRSAWRGIKAAQGF